MMITRKPMGRRAMLRGAGTMMALPLLEAMMGSARAAEEAAAARKRLQVIYTPNGMMMENWTPAASGENFAFSPILKPLEPYRQKLAVFTGLSHVQAEALGDGAGDHGRCCGGYLTGVHVKKTEGADITSGISMDQLVAKQFGDQTQIPSLEIGLEPPSLVGSCDSGYSCAYTNTLSWSSPSTPLPVTINPREVFERLFGDGDSLDAKSRLAQLRRQASILDFVAADAKRMSGKLGSSDKEKLDEYLQAVRDIEKRIQKVEQGGTSAVALPAYSKPAGVPDSFEDYSHMMIDLQVLAMQADMTRVATFMIGREVSGRSYPEIGVPDAHHPLSHHGNDPEKIAKLTKINTLHMEQVAYYLKRMSETKDGGKPLLDSTIVMAGASLADPNRHDHRNLPVFVAGGLIKGNRHVMVDKDTPMTNMMLAMMDTLGVQADKLGDSTGRLTTFAA
ncbi:MAG TPA: DUF1552 domain-containing protein [Rhizomicrobium sp.]|jgi:hypothetical protein|nr:DUF1552 domain-containing protein [Rhizomicrobium sp.]